MKFITTSIFLFISLPVFANGITDWQLGFQEPASGVMQNIFDLHNFVLIMMTAILSLIHISEPTRRS